MYIEDRLFSENTEETLYSVLMDEDEYALYSEFQKEFGIIGAIKGGVSSIAKRLGIGKKKAESFKEVVGDIKQLTKKEKKALKKKKMVEEFESSWDPVEKEIFGTDSRTVLRLARRTAQSADPMYRNGVPQTIKQRGLNKAMDKFERLPFEKQNELLKKAFERIKE